MFAGKTKHLIDTARQWPAAKVLIINSVRDTRYTDQDRLVSHDPSHESIPCIRCEDVLPLTLGTEEVRAVFINEAQFFDNLVPFVLHQLQQNRYVMVSGLDGDYKQQLFGQMAQLIPYCDTIIKLVGRCDCGKPSIMSKRTAQTQTQTLIGGAESYRPCCRQCIECIG